MTVTGPTKIEYRGWAVAPGRALLWLDADAGVAAVLDPPDNPGTSVTNAVEQLVMQLRSAHGEQLRVFTVALADPVFATAIFEVDLRDGEPTWEPLLDMSDAPEVVRRARIHAEKLAREQESRRAKAAGHPERRGDEPIASFADDRLDRADFARALAEDVRRAPRQSGFVMALNGAWGEGKTSVLNLVAADLRAENEAEIVHFNPWLFSGTEQLVEHFFEELTGQLRETNSRRLEEVSAALETYGRIVKPLRVLPIVGGMLAGSGDLAAEASAAIAGERGTVRARAGRLRGELADLDRPIVVMVDDLDRLRPAEIIEVMRLVRLVGDFPNLVYLLAFDRPRVEDALGEGDSERGRAYLEKIVQIAHDLPPLRDEALTALLSEDASAAVGDVDRYHFDVEHFQDVFWAGTLRLFKTVRDVRRFTNVLPATLELLRDEVDLGDMMALEALRIFVADTFRLIASRPDAFTTVSGRGLGSDRADREHEATVKQAIDLASPGNASTVSSLIRRLFPATERHLGGSHYGADWLETWRRQRRVAHPEVLGTYLRRRLPPGAIAAARMDAIVQALEDDERLDRILRDLDDDQLEQALSRLEGYEEDFPGTRPEVTIGVLSRHGRRLTRHPRSMFELGPRVQLSRIVYRLLRNLEPGIVARTVEATDFQDFSSRYDVVRMVGHREGAGHKLVDEATAERLEGQLIDDLLRAAAEELSREPDLGALIWLLRRERPTDAPAAVQDWAATDAFFVALLRAHLLISLGATVGSVAVRRTLQLKWPDLASLLGQHYLATRLSQVNPGWVAETYDDDTLEAWRQARRYAQDPDAAERDLRHWPDGGADED